MKLKILFSILIYVLFFENNLLSQYGWTKVTDVINKPMNKVFFVNERYGWMVGANGTILHSSDSGKTWRQQSISSEMELNSIFFINQNVGWVVGFAEMETKYSIYKTTDGGNTWIGYNPGDWYAVRDVFFINQNVGWACGDDAKIPRKGVLLKTTNGGNSWEVILNENFREFRSIHFSSINNGIICGAFGRAGITTNGGTSWNLKEVEGSGSAYWYDAYSVSATTGFISGAGGRIFKTTNSGGTWQSLVTNNITISPFNCITFKENYGWAGSRNGKVIRTTDYGATWNEQLPEIPNLEIKEICMLDKQKGWLLGTIGGSTYLLKTATGGEFVEYKFKASINTVGYTQFCEGDSVILVAVPSGDDFSYEWSTGETNQTIVVNQTGKYKLTIYHKSGSKDSAEIDIVVYPLPKPRIIGDTLICENQILILSSDKDFKSYKWSTGENTKSIEINKDGTYILEVKNENNCIGFDTLVIKKAQTKLSRIPAGDINFELVKISTTHSMFIMLSNDGENDIEISDILILKLKEIFNVIIDINDKILLKPKTTLKLNIDFSPKEEKIYQDSIKIVVTKPCPLEIYIPISGKGTYLSISDDNKISEKIINPNPATDYIEIAIPADLLGGNIQQVRIYNMLGQSVINYELQSTNNETKAKIDIRHLPAGLYYIRICGKGLPFVKN